MVASKKVHCAFCHKKCTGKVLRYQDQYYHKQCFELEQQSESLAPAPNEQLDERIQVQQGHFLAPTQTQQTQPTNQQAAAAANPTTTQAHTQAQTTSSTSGRQTTGEAAPSGRTNLYIESAASPASTWRAPLNERSSENDPNLQRQTTTTTTTTRTTSSSSSNQTRVFTSYNSRSQNQLDELPEEELASDEKRATASHSYKLSAENNSPAARNSSSCQDLSSGTAKQAASPSERPSSGQMNRSPSTGGGGGGGRSATLPHSISSPSNGFAQTSQGNSTNAASRTLDSRPQQQQSNGSARQTACAGCRERIVDGQALIALDLHWHVWCFKCVQCKAPLHGEYVAKDGKAYCERDYQKLFGISCVYCKRYITGKVLQAGEAHHFHPSCARCSKCGDPFVPGEEMYLQGEVTWHPRCGPGPNTTTGPPESSLMEADDRSQLRNARAHSPSLSSRSRSRSASPFSYMSRQYGRASPTYADSEAVGDLSRIYTISYLNADPNQGYLRRPVEPNPPKSPQFSRPTSMSRLAGGDRSRSSSRSQQYVYGSSAGLPGLPRDRSIPRGMYSLLSGMGRSGASSRARSPSMMNEEAIQLAAYPSGQKPAPDSVPTIERDDFPAPPFPYPDRHHHHHHHRHRRHHDEDDRVRSHSSSQRASHNGHHHHHHHHHTRQAHQTNGSGAPAEQRVERAQRGQQERASRPRSREIVTDQLERSDSLSSSDSDPQLRKEEEELSKIANGIGKIFLQTLKEREKLRAWKRANLDPRNASRTPSATRELPSRLRYENPTNASPSRDLDRPRPWDEDELLSQAGGGGGDQSPTRTRSSLGRSTAMSGAGGGAVTPLAGPAPSAISSTYGYKVVQANRAILKPGYGVTSGAYSSSLANGATSADLHLSFAERQRIAQARANDLLGRQGAQISPMAAGANGPSSTIQSEFGAIKLPNFTSSSSTRSLASAAHLRRSMPNVANLHHLHQEGAAPKLYPYHLLATSNYRLPPEVDRCHLERHLSNEEFQYIFHCDRLDFYRLPEWKRNELKRRARLF